MVDNYDRELFGDVDHFSILCFFGFLEIAHVFRCFFGYLLAPDLLLAVGEGRSLCANPFYWLCLYAGEEKFAVIHFLDFGSLFVQGFLLGEIVVLFCHIERVLGVLLDHLVHDGFAG